MPEDSYEPPTPGELQDLLHRIVESPDEALRDNREQFAKLLPLLEMARERLYQLCGRPMPAQEQAPKPKNPPTGPSVGHVFLPIASVNIGGPPPQAPLTIRTNWEPNWRGEAQERIAALNLQLLNGEYGLLDRDAQTHGPCTLGSLTPEFIGALFDTLEMQLRPHALCIPKRPSEIEPILKDAKRKR